MSKVRLIVLVLIALVALAIGFTVSRPRTLPLAVHTIRADDAMLQQVQGLGASAIVQVFSWSDIQPSPERWEWEYTDWLVRAADHYGLQVIPRLDKPPAWAVADPTALSAPPRNLNTYNEFVRRVAERYRGKIPAYIIWNEPNLASEWGNQPPDASAYAALLQGASKTIRATDPEAKVIAAGLSPTNENSARAQDDRTFLKGMYAAGAAGAFDVLAAHPYAFAQSPDAPREANSGLTFERIQDWRDIMTANSDANKPIWITEFGYPTEQPPQDADRVVTEAQQADYIARAYDKARDELPWVDLFTVWNIVKTVPPTDEQAGYTLVRPDGSTKPAYEAVRQLQKQSPISNLQSLFADLVAPTPTKTVFPVLARDTIVHLGDSEYPAPFVPLYQGANPSVNWKGQFYLDDTALRGERATKDWTVYAELMQVNDFDSRVWVNDVPVAPPFLPVEDFTSKWVTAQFTIPAKALRVGSNAVAIQDGKLVPALQQSGFTWDEVQVRNMRVVPP